MFYLIIFLNIIVILLLLKIYSLKRAEKTAETEAKCQFQRAESSDASKAVLLLWLKHKAHGHKLSAYFTEHNMKTIAIYGMAEAGILLYRELKNDGIHIACGIDRSSRYVCDDLNIIKPDEFTGNVDAVIVTPVYYFSEIYDLFHDKFKGAIPILGMDEILYGLGEV